MNDPDKKAGQTGAELPPAELVEEVEPSPEFIKSDEGIASVNDAQRAPQRKAKVLFVLLVVALLIGALAWVSTRWLTGQKNSFVKPKAMAAATTEVDAKNPEGSVHRPPALGAAAEKLEQAPTPVAAVHTTEQGIKPLRGADGKVMVDGKGRALGVDAGGNVVPVPGIEPLVDDGKKPLPGGQTATAAPGMGGGQQQAKPRSRFGGSLNADGANASTQVAQGQAQAASQAEPTKPVDELLKALGVIQSNKAQGGAGAAASADAGDGASSKQPAGSVGSQLQASVTPVQKAKYLSNQDMLLPKGRQMDCISTTRIINEQPGFTTCVLAQNLYSDNGKVLLAEKGSEFVGEYGINNQAGLRRLWIVWTRLKTRDGIQIDLMSPGADTLGTSGVPGYLENRWLERIGTAWMVSLMQDVIAYQANKNLPPAPSGLGGLFYQPPPNRLQNTQDATQTIVEQIIKQTIQVRPTLYINEGERISIYVARDLDFGSVYGLRHVGAASRK